MKYPSLANFRTRAVIDWVEINITTKNATNFPTIQTHLQKALGTAKKNWVRALDEGTGRAATMFVIKLHDPKTHASLTDLFAGLEHRFPLASLPQLSAMEVSVDFYSRSNNREELKWMVTRLKRETANTGANPRQFGPFGKMGRLETRRLAYGEEANARGTYYAGTRDTDPVTWRIYLKETDNNQEPILDAALHRARTEVTLRGDGPSQYATTLDSLGTMRFEELAKLLKCRVFVPPEPDTSLPPLLRRRDDQKRKDICQAARAGQHMLKVTKRRKFSHHSRADLDLNTLIRESLRGLTKRFGAKKRGGLKIRKRISRGTGPSALLTPILTTIPSGVGSPPGLPASL